MARFIGFGAVFAGRAGRGHVKIVGIDLPADAASAHAEGSSVEIFIRPEKVRLEALNGHVPDGSVSGDVRETIFLGSLTRVRMQSHANPDLQIWADLASEYAEPFKLGSKVVAQWDAAAPRVMPGQ